MEQLKGPRKAKIVIPSPPLTPDDVIDVIKGRSWKADIVKESEISNLVPIGPRGLMKCFDGHPSNNLAMNGPKKLGSVYAIATNRSVTDIDGLKRIVEEIKVVTLLGAES